MRLSKQQRAFQAETLETLGLANQFKPSTALVVEMATALVIERKFHSITAFKLAMEKSKPIHVILLERWGWKGERC